MRKILLIGNSPLPNENVKARPAAGLRTWQFVRGLGGASGVGNGAGGDSATNGNDDGESSGASGVNRASGFEIKSVTIAMPECYGGDVQQNEKNGDYSTFKNKSRDGLFEPKNETKSLYVQTSMQEGRLNVKNKEESESLAKQVSVQKNGYSDFEKSGFGHIQLSKDDTNLLKKMQKIHDEYRPEVIIAVNTYPAFIASSIKSSAPLWADLNGWIMAEAQAQAYKMGSNDYLLHYTEMEDLILRRADKFSVTSEAQKFTVLGELASIGRLCAESFGYEFCHVVRNGMEWFEGEREAMATGVGSQAGKRSGSSNVGVRAMTDNNDLVKSNLQNGHVSTQMSENGLDIKNSKESKSVPGHTLEGADGSSSNELAGVVNDLFKFVPGNAFILLWMGGYNTWVDEVTLFSGVEAAMQNCENLYFVSTGGEIEGLDNKTFANFKLLIDGSAFKDRFVFLGWVDTKLIPYIYKAADVGLNVDKLCVETLTGARNRINEMMKFGLPIITTLGSEISYEVMRVGAGVGVASGKSELLSEAIVRMWKEAGGRGRSGNESRGNSGRACGDGSSGVRVRGSNGSVDSASGGNNFASYGKNGQQYIEKFCNYAVTLKPLLKWLEHPIAAPDRGVVTSRSGLLPIGALRGGLKYLRENGVGKFSKKLWQRIKMG